MDTDLEVLLYAAAFAAAWIGLSWLLFGRAKK
jgi:hypothetical protein